MILLALALFLVLLLDQAIKELLERRLGMRAIPLGILGSVRLVKAPIWLARPGTRPRLMVLTAVWLVSAAALVSFSCWRPAFAPFVGLLLGGSLSHAWEHARRGCVRDYICLRFWPAFNFADIAITCGGIGILLQLVSLLMKGGL
jgi:lipoprotein signal peptidase